MKLAIGALALMLMFGVSIKPSLAADSLLGHKSLAYALELEIPRLLITTTGVGVDISLELANIFSFSEAAALSQLSRHELKSRLEAGADLFQLNAAAECSLSQAQAISDFLAQQKTKQAKQALDVSWSFACTKPQALNSLKIAWFTHFPQSLANLVIEWTSAEAEGRLETSADTVIYFEPEL
ncbi:MAG: DUF2796 domain-containing protein [Thiothrix sp.]|nr:MAG: DUF2796 domain-containing protein [Thiothrix sp.]